MSFKAILHFKDLSINLLESTISFKEEVDYNGCPSGPPKLTNVRCLAEATQDISLWEWAIANYKLMNLKLEYQPIRIDSKSRNYYFYDSNCHMYTEHYSHNGQNNYRIIIEFVAAIFKTDNLVLEKHWKVTDLEARDVVPTVLDRDPFTEILNIVWINSETKETIDKVDYAQTVSLTAQIENPQGTSAKITIEKEDGTEFENGQKQLVFDEEINEDGSVELTSIEIKEQWQDFKTSDRDKLIAKVEHNNTNRNSAQLTIMPKAKVLVNFRVHDNYKGEYGFDWMRMGDTGKPGDVWYKDIIRNYVKKKDDLGNTIYEDGKPVYISIDSYNKYVQLGKKYDQEDHPIKPNDIYLVPVLALFPNKSATFSLKVEVAENDAKKIEFEYDENLFSLSKPEVSYKTMGKETLHDYLTIKCIEEFGTDQYITVLADGEFAGKLKVLANDKAHRRRADIIFVKVKTNLSGTGRDKIGSDKNEKIFLTKYLSQSLTNSNILTKELDLTANAILNSKYRLKDGTIYLINDIAGIHGHLEKEFEKHFSGYTNYFKVFMFDELGGEMKKESVKYYNGAAKSLNSKAVAVYNTRGKSTTTHEIFHAMGLEHSFDFNSEFIFEKTKTDNIMDYSHQVGIDRISTFMWQWDTIKPNLTKE